MTKPKTKPEATILTPGHPGLRAGSLLLPGQGRAASAACTGPALGLPRAATDCFAPATDRVAG